MDGTRIGYRKLVLAWWGTTKLHQVFWVFGCVAGYACHYKPVELSPWVVFFCCRKKKGCIWYNVFFWWNRTLTIDRGSSEKPGFRFHFLWFPMSRLNPQSKRMNQLMLLQTQVPKSIKCLEIFKWRFPEIGVPPNHQCSWIFSSSTIRF